MQSLTRDGIKSNPYKLKGIPAGEKLVACHAIQLRPYASGQWKLQSSHPDFHW